MYLFYVFLNSYKRLHCVMQIFDLWVAEHLITCFVIIFVFVLLQWWPLFPKQELRFHSTYLILNALWGRYEFQYKCCLYGCLSYCPKHRHTHTTLCEFSRTSLFIRSETAVMTLLQARPWQSSPERSSLKKKTNYFQTTFIQTRSNMFMVWKTQEQIYKSL